jgi:hypothetical protein
MALPPNREIGAPVPAANLFGLSILVDQRLAEPELDFSSADLAVDAIRTRTADLLQWIEA